MPSLAKRLRAPAGAEHHGRAATGFATIHIAHVRAGYHLTNMDMQTRTVRSVLFVTPRWARDGGVGTHVTASAELLAGHGIDVTVLAAQTLHEADIPGVKLYRQPDLFKRDKPIASRIGEALSFAPDIVHFHQFDHPEILAAMRSSAPVVISAHAYTACTSGVHYFRPGEECRRAHGPGCVPNLLLRGCAHVRNVTTLPTRYERAGRGLQALRSADLAISYSSAIDRHLATNGITHRTIVPLFPTLAPRPSSAHAGRRRVLFAGRIIPPKGIGVLVRAARYVDAEFLICGDGRSLNAMRGLARRLHVEQRVRFTGWLSREELAEQLADTSLATLPSLWPEPFGLVGIEAFAAARPVIATSTGGVGDWLEHGINGLLVRPGDIAGLARALNELLADPDRQLEMGLAGQALVRRRFSPEQHLEGLLEAYRTARISWERSRARAQPPLSMRPS